MSRIKRIAFIGNSLPRRCGIATFTTDLQQAVAASPLPLETAIIAITDPGQSYPYPKAVAFEVQQERLEDYVRASEFINKNRFDAVSLQHEFGIFGGESGEYILDLLDRLTVPVVTTLHTVLSEPSMVQRRIIQRILAVSVRVVVMAEKGRELLLSVYGADFGRVEVIPHGIPDFAFVGPETAKKKLGYNGKTVILTFGLLSPNKGIEVVIDAMPQVLESRPDATYIVLGATHPNLVRDQGEAYREGLQARAAKLGIGAHVVFLDQFVDRPTLLEYIAMCDVYVTPYLNQAQMTSGTLAYSFGLGNAVVSTPYWHARELLDDGHGVLVPFGNAAATGLAIADLLTDEPRRQAMRQRAYADSRHMTWERVADRYVALIEAAAAPGRTARLSGSGQLAALPAMALDHLETMSDATGLFQHAIHCVPDRSHGYCVDDNARALLLASILAAGGRETIPERLTSSYAAFVQHAFNPDTGRFRNFMSFSRQWLEVEGSEDSHGRTLWALGVTARNDANKARRAWAAALFEQALPAVQDFSSPRSWAFTLLGLHAYCATSSKNALASKLQLTLADRLVELLEKVETPDWVWLEEGLSYDNARLCEALILSGRSTGTERYGAAGLRMLAWLMRHQTNPSGQFRPVGSQGFGDIRQSPRQFDQQPIEAAATIAACLSAWRMRSDTRWSNAASRTFSWFLGSNDLGLALVDPLTGSCRDGLHPDRRNENRGGESVVSYLLSLADMRQFERLTLVEGQPLGPQTTNPVSPLHHKHQFRGRLVASNFPEPAGPLPPT
jgi:glycosyltransferase involved in cell wall biosynthesis